MAPPADNSRPFFRASLLLIGLAWTLPFLQPYHRYPLTAFYSEWLAFALGLGAALVLLRKESWRDAALPAVGIAPVGLIVVLWLQVAMGRVPYAEQALTATLYLLWAMLLILLGHRLRRDLGTTVISTALSWFLMIGGLLAAFAGLVQHYQLSTLLNFLVLSKLGAAVYGNLGQPNHYAAYVMLALGGTAYLYGRAHLGVATALAFAAPLLMVLALSGSRSAWLYLVTLAALAWLPFRSRRDAESRRLALFMSWLLAGFVAAQWLAVLPLTPAAGIATVDSAERVFQTVSGAEPRVQLWSEAWQMYLHAPVLGAGLGQFAWHHFLNVAATGATSAPGVYNHAHNILLHLMAETGTVGALIVVGAALLWLTDLKGASLDLDRWWQLALLAVIGIHSTLEYPLWYAYFIGVAAPLLGLGAERVFVLRFGRVARMVVGFGLIAGWLNLVAVLPSYREFELLVFIPQKSNAPPVDEETFSRAIAAIHREPLLAPYVELAVAYGITLTESRLPEKLALTARAMRFAPVSVVVYRHALLLALAGEREAALAQLKRSLRAYPEDARDIAAQLEVLASRHPGAFTPLLEFAQARTAEIRARAATQ